MINADQILLKAIEIKFQATRYKGENKSGEYRSLFLIFPYAVKFEVKRFIWKQPMAYAYICGPKTS
jgi:hypothetical protein